MDDKTRQQEIDRLRRLYYEKDKEFEAAKRKRTLITWLGFAALFFCLFICSTDVYGMEILGVLGASLFLSAFYVLINVLIFGWLAGKGNDETQILASIEKRIRDLENK